MSELIFLDLEWNTTFYRSRSGERLPFHELIEVAAIKVAQDTGAMLDSFHSYVHPKASRKIESRTYRLLPYEQRKAEKHKHNRTDTEVHQILHYNVACILGTGKARLHHCKAALHKEHECGTYQKPNAESIVTDKCIDLFVQHI